MKDVTLFLKRQVAELSLWKTISLLCGKGIRVNSPSLVLPYYTPIPIAFRDLWDHSDFPRFSSLSKSLSAPAAVCGGCKRSRTVVVSHPRNHIVPFESKKRNVARYNRHYKKGLQCGLDVGMDEGVHLHTLVRAELNFCLTDELLTTKTNVGVAPGNLFRVRVFSARCQRVLDGVGRDRRPKYPWLASRLGTGTIEDR